jgi:hypothetical protein
MELDGAEGALEGSFTLTNGSLKGFDGGGEYADLRDGVRTTISNCYFFNFSDDSDIELDNDGVSANYKDGLITFTNTQFNVSHLTSGFITIDEIFADKSTAGDGFTIIAPGATVVTTPTVGASKAAFAGWSMADAAGELNDF